MYLMNRYMYVKVFSVKIVRSRGDPSSEDCDSRQYAEGVTADFLTVGTQGCPHPSGFVCVSVS